MDVIVLLMVISIVEGKFSVMIEKFGKEFNTHVVPSLFSLCLRIDCVIMARASKILTMMRLRSLGNNLTISSICE